MGKCKQSHHYDYWNKHIQIHTVITKIQSKYTCKGGTNTLTDINCSIVSAISLSYITFPSCFYAPDLNCWLKSSVANTKKAAAIRSQLRELAKEITTNTRANNIAQG